MRCLETILCSKTKLNMAPGWSPKLNIFCDINQRLNINWYLYDPHRELKMHICIAPQYICEKPKITENEQKLNKTFWFLWDSCSSQTACLPCLIQASIQVIISKSGKDNKSTDDVPSKPSTGCFFLNLTDRFGRSGKPELSSGILIRPCS